MKAVVQRVLSAEVEVGDDIVGQIGPGLLVYLGVEKGDTSLDLEWMLGKVTSLRIFPDQNEKMTFPVSEIAGGVLVVSQFTLCADVSKGNRPSFTPAADPEYAEMIYKAFIKGIEKVNIPTASGEFGAMMRVKSLNDGPVTILLDSKTKVS
ncbi:D-tyrosyl-tRNA(Tyr) deacylase [Patescibacteria group bacterium]|nr:D-tyrosyl-tRNA(Tyr) deacylase [Patescibacteria group bacterium]